MNRIKFSIGMVWNSSWIWSQALTKFGFGDKIRETRFRNNAFSFFTVHKLYDNNLSTSRVALSSH